MFGPQVKAAIGVALVLLVGGAAAQANEGSSVYDWGNTAPALNGAYHWLVVRVTDAGSPAAATIEIRREGNPVGVYSLRANSGQRVQIWSSPPNRRYAIKCTYKGRTMTKHAYATKPPTHVRFHFANGQLN